MSFEFNREHRTKEKPTSRVEWVENRFAAQLHSCCDGYALRKFDVITKNQLFRIPDKAMAGDKSQTDLNAISNEFTEETINNVFSKITKAKDVKVVKWDCASVGGTGDSYMANTFKIKINGVADGKSVETRVFIKAISKNVGRRKTYRSAEFFYNEIMFYTKVIPKFQEFLLEKGQSHLLCTPVHILSYTNGNDDYIVLEDVSPLGFVPVSRQNCITIDECTVVLQAMARFHAISFAYKNQNPDAFKEMASHLQETYFKNETWDWYKRYHRNLTNVAGNALAIEYPDSVAKKKFDSQVFGDWYKKCIEFCDRKEAPTSVITQGDSWAPNFMIRQVGNDQEVLILDFQLAHVTSPVLDLAFCIYSCTDQALRDKHFDDILKIYHKELSATIALLGSDPEHIYPWNKFLEEVKEMFIYGVVFAMEAIPFSMLGESEVFDLDNLIKGDEAVNIADVWVISNVKTKEGRLRLANIIVHAVERGFL
ncbi:hypothetical protein KM043_010648 [Ampulex compressa]|nr:hypothetical protein KM043_010648 [Ampulex compressa]